ncbi:MAG: universal stress protein [Pseudomonadota bacterium]
MFKTILLPIDLNHDASWLKALPAARGVASADGTLHLLGIVPDFGMSMVASYFPKDFEERALGDMKAALEAFAAEHGGAETHVGHGHVPETILSTAKSVGADVIVMASHPPDELRSLLVGSHAEKVVRHATTPVLVVR